MLKMLIYLHMSGKSSKFVMPKAGDWYTHACACTYIIKGVNIKLR